MAYTKITPALFAESLKAGKYKDGTAAKRAIAKCQLKEKDKAKCLAAIDAHFPKSAAPKAAPSKKKAVKVARKKAPKAAGPSKKKVAKKKAAKKPAPRNNHKGASKKHFDSTEAELAQISLAKERVGTLTQAIQAMKLAKDVNPNLDTKRGTQAIQDALTGVVEGVQQRIEQPQQLQLGEGPGIDPEVARKFAESKGAAVPPPGAMPPQPPAAGQEATEGQGAAQA